MSKSKSATKKAPRVTNASVMREYYASEVLPNIGTVPNKVLRRAFINHQMTTLGSSDPASASLFNVIQKENIAAGTVSATAVGRGAQAAAKEASEEEAAGPDMSLAWAVINKESREVVETYPSRRAAAAAKTADETVKKTADL